MSCMNTQMMNSRQDDEDRAERLAFAIEARAAELLTHGEACDPLDGINAIAALETATSIDQKFFGGLLAHGDYAGCGLWIEMLSKTYWAKMADEMAERELT